MIKEYKLYAIYKIIDDTFISYFNICERDNWIQTWYPEIGEYVMILENRPTLPTGISGPLTYILYLPNMTFWYAFFGDDNALELVVE